MRTVIGFALAPILPIVFLGLWDRSTMAVVAGFAYLGVIAFGVPAHLSLQKLGWVGWPAYTGAGFVAGLFLALLGGVVLVVSDHKPRGADSLVRALDAIGGIVREPLPVVFIGMMGLVGGATFWLLVRPDTQSSAAAAN